MGRRAGLHSQRGPRARQAAKRVKVRVRVRVRVKGEGEGEGEGEGGEE